MGQGRAQIYNLISILFLVLTVVTVILVALRMSAPPPEPTVSIVVPTAAILPTLTNTLTPSPTETPIPTETPSQTITPTIPPSVTWTQIPTLTASLTSTIPPSLTTAPSATIGPTETPSDTPSVPPSLTITNTLQVTPTDIPPTTNSFTPQPTVPPPSPFPFALQNEVIYTVNFANTAACAWQGIGGRVYDLSGQELRGVRVHVFGAGIDQFTTSGSNTLYGVSGWEVPLSTTLTSNSYIVELQTEQGTIISPQITVTFTPDCSRNLALVNFEQERPF